MTRTSASVVTSISSRAKQPSGSGGSGSPSGRPESTKPSQVCSQPRTSCAAFISSRRTWAMSRRMCGSFFSLRVEDVAALAAGARHDHDLGARGDVPGHRRRALAGLVVRVRVDAHEPEPVGHVGPFACSGSGRSREWTPSILSSGAGPRTTDAGPDRGPVCRCPAPLPAPPVVGGRHRRLPGRRRRHRVVGHRLDRRQRAPGDHRLQGQVRHLGRRGDDLHRPAGVAVVCRISALDAGTTGSARSRTRVPARAHVGAPGRCRCAPACGP